MAEQKNLPNYLTEISSSSSFWSSIFTWHTFLLPLYTENTSIKSFKQTFIAIDGILSTLNHPYVNLKPFEATIDENRFSQAKVKIHEKKKWAHKYFDAQKTMACFMQIFFFLFDSSNDTKMLWIVHTKSIDVFNCMIPPFQMLSHLQIIWKLKLYIWCRTILLRIHQFNIPRKIWKQCKICDFLANRCKTEKTTIEKPAEKVYNKLLYASKNWIATNNKWFISSRESNWSRKSRKSLMAIKKKWGIL